MRFNSTKEEVIFDKSKQEKALFIDLVFPNNVIQDIEEIKNNKESVYMFNSGDKADFLYERSCVNDLSFNYFQIYNKSIFLCYKKILHGLKELMSEKSISVEKNLYYITSEYETEFLEDYWYDTGGNGIPNFAGYWFLETKDDASIKINGQKIFVETGSIVIFLSGARTEFIGINKGISFNVATLSKIQSQYPQKWMPVILS